MAQEGTPHSHPHVVNHVNICGKDIHLHWEAARTCQNLGLPSSLGKMTRNRKGQKKRKIKLPQGESGHWMNLMILAREGDGSADRALAAKPARLSPTPGTYLGEGTD